MSASPRPRAGKPSVWVFDGYLMAERETTAWNAVKALQTPGNKGGRVFDGRRLCVLSVAPVVFGQNDRESAKVCQKQCASKTGETARILAFQGVFF